MKLISDTDAKMLMMIEKVKILIGTDTKMDTDGDAEGEIDADVDNG